MARGSLRLLLTNVSEEGPTDSGLLIDPFTVGDCSVIEKSSQVRRNSVEINGSPV